MGFQRQSPLPLPAAPPRPARRRIMVLRVAAGCAALGMSALTMGCAQSAEDAAPQPMAQASQQPQPVGAPQVGHASYYARHFAGRRMASGGRFDPASDTIAHRTLPFGTMWGEPTSTRPDHIGTVQSRALRAGASSIHPPSRAT